jgi:hypothetical protein
MNEKDSASEPVELPPAYDPPMLTVYGTLLDLTHGGASGGKEGAGPLRKRASA